MSLHRRRTVLLGGISSLATFAIVSSPVVAAEFEYKLGHTQTVDTPQHVRLVQLAKQIAKETNGRLNISIFPASQLGGQDAMVSQLRLGALQILVTGNATFATVVPASYIDSMPFVFTDSRVAWRVMTGPVSDYVHKEFAAKNLYVPKGSLIDSGIRQVTTSTKPIRTVDDFNGVKLRVAPGAIYVDLFKTLGASPVLLDQNSVYTALQTRLVDGQDSPFQVIETQRIYEVQKYLSVTNHVWTGSSFVLNGDAWKALPGDVQGIIDRNVVKYSGIQREDSLRLNTALAEKLQRQGMVLNNPNIPGMRARVQPLYARWKEQLGSTLWTLFEEQLGMKIG